MANEILIVEDEIFVALDIERILADAGYTVAGIAADRDAALAEGAHADIAFVDVNLRDGPTGPDIACELARRNGTKVFYVTANPSQIAPIADTAIGVIRKPFTADAIRTAASFADGGDPRDVTRHAEITLFPSVA